MRRIAFFAMAGALLCAPSQDTRCRPRRSRYGAGCGEHDGFERIEARFVDRRSRSGCGSARAVREVGRRGRVERRWSRARDKLDQAFDWIAREEVDFDSFDGEALDSRQEACDEPRQVHWCRGDPLNRHTQGEHGHRAQASDAETFDCSPWNLHAARSWDDRRRQHRRRGRNPELKLRRRGLRIGAAPAARRGRRDSSASRACLLRRLHRDP